MASDELAGESNSIQKNAGQVTSSEGEVDILDVLITLSGYKRHLVLIPLAVGILVGALSFLFPNIYVGTARVLPPNQNSSNSAALVAQFTGGLGSAGAAAALGIKSPSDLYVGMLKSRTVADKLIQKFDLRTVYDKGTLIDTRDKLADMSSILADAVTGIVSIDVKDEDPKRAADMANAYVEELLVLSQQLGVSEAGQRRAFYENRLKAVRESLGGAEDSLRKMQEKTGLIRLEDQARGIVEGTASLQAQIALREVELEAMRTYATEDNPAYLQSIAKLSGLKIQLGRMERESEKRGKGDIFIPTGKVPELGLEYLRKVRDVRYFEELFALLGKQVELARLDEARDTALLQVLDSAVVPDKKAQPKHLLIALISVVAGVLFTTVGIFLCEAIKRSEADPLRRQRIRALREGFRLFRSK